MQARLEERNRREVEEERKRVEESQQRALEENARRAMVVRPVTNAATHSSLTQTALPTVNIDFTLEARKAARILSCATDNVRVSGVEGANILFIAACDDGQRLVLTCDQLGLCLRK